MTAYGAKGDGRHDDTEAINAAIQDVNRCGEHTYLEGKSILPSQLYVDATGK
jgi:polygalacturonase